MYDKVDRGRSGVISKSVKKLSKGRKIVKKSEKPQKPEKLQRSSVWKKVYQSTGPLSTKNSSFYWSSNSFSCSFCWAQNLRRYHFDFDYWQSKADKTADVLSTPSSYLRSAHVPSATSALECTPSPSTLRRLENSLRTSPFRYFNLGDMLWKKTSQPKIKVDMLDGWEDVEGVVHHQGLSYIPEIIIIELTCRHHDERTLVLRKLEDLLPRKSTRPAIATYWLEGH